MHERVFPALLFLTLTTRPLRSPARLAEHGLVRFAFAYRPQKRGALGNGMQYLVLKRFVQSYFILGENEKTRRK